MPRRFGARYFFATYPLATHHATAATFANNDRATFALPFGGFVQRRQPTPPTTVTTPAPTVTTYPASVLLVAARWTRLPVVLFVALRLLDCSVDGLVLHLPHGFDTCFRTTTRCDVDTLPRCCVLYPAPRLLFRYIPAPRFIRVAYRYDHIANVQPR